MANDLKHITQHVIVVKTESEKLYRLQELLEELGDKTALVFTNTKKSADSLTKALNKAGGGGDEKKKKKKKAGGYRVTTIHGDKSPSERAISSHDFSAKIYNVLVSTEEAARGIELPHGVDVINYDLPANIDIYIKQTGRAGNKTGIATTFFSTLGLYCWYDNDKVLGDITQMLIQSNSPVPPELRGRYGKRIC